MTCQLVIQGLPPIVLGKDSAPVTVGRGNDNRIAIDEPSLSRQHGFFQADEQGCYYEDCQSRNGSKLNGHQLKARCTLHIGDVLELGRIHVRIEAAAQHVLEAASEQLFPLEQVRKSFSALESHGGKTLEESLNLLQDISLDLIHDAPLQSQVKQILERLHLMLKPRRLVALLRSEGGDFLPIASVPHSKEDLPVSRTAVASICESRQALLVQDRLSDVRVQHATSLVHQSIRSLMAAPLECEGMVEGLLYADAGLAREPFGKRELALLATVAHMLAARIRTLRLLEQREQARSMEREMALARLIQRNLLPEADPKTPNFEFLGRAVPSRQVGGDLYGYWQPTPARLFAAIADVSGKGVGPGLLMACLVAYMNGSTRTNPETASLATWLSRDLAGHTSRNRFATAFLLRLDPEADWVEYTNAGHNPGLLVDAAGVITRLESQGLPLAMFPGKVPYGQSRITMQPGDLLFLYTDGITEATNALDEEFGMDRLEQALVAFREQPLEELVRRLDGCMASFSGEVPFGDDRTFLIVRRSRIPAGS